MMRLRRIRRHVKNATSTLQNSLARTAYLPNLTHAVVRRSVEYQDGMGQCLSRPTRRCCTVASEKVGKLISARLIVRAAVVSDILASLGCEKAKVVSQWHTVSANIVRTEGNNTKTLEVLTHFHHNPTASQR